MNPDNIFYQHATRLSLTSYSGVLPLTLKLQNQDYMI